MWLLNSLKMTTLYKVGKILKGSLDSIPSPSPSVKIQIMSGKVCLKCKGKTLLGDVNKLFVFKSLLTMPSNVLPLHLKQTFPPIIWIFTEGESDGIKSRLPFKFFSSLLLYFMNISSFAFNFFNLGDFVVDLKWDFTSWLPLVSRILPSDICKISKKGACIRLDTTLVDFTG